MTLLIQDQLNSAQKQIYSLSNIKRTFPDFDETDINSIHLKETSIVAVYQDGTELCYAKQPIIDTYRTFTMRLKDFFSYLGPNFRGPSIWHNNSYVIFKGWHYQHQLTANTGSAMLQREWIDKFMHLKDPAKLKALLQNEHTDLGYLIAPDGFCTPEHELNLNTELEDVDTKPVVPTKEPYCSCGSFSNQILNLTELQQEIPGYKPTCIHLTWFAKYRELLCRRTEIRESSPTYVPDKCVAWWYAPPETASGKGRFLLLHTKHGPQAPITHWRTYKPQELFTRDDAWTLFDSMMNAGYVPYPGVALPQLKQALQKI
jgi:hypothetical protein